MPAHRCLHGLRREPQGPRELADAPSGAAFDQIESPAVRPMPPQFGKLPVGIVGEREVDKQEQLKARPPSALYSFRNAGSRGTSISLPLPQIRQSDCFFAAAIMPDRAKQAASTSGRVRGNWSVDASSASWPLP